MKSEVEEDRQKSLKTLNDASFEKYVPGSFGCHEVLHVTSLLTENVSRHLLEHPAIVIDPEFYQLAHEAHTTLFRLYQAIGAKHLMANS